MALGDVSTAVAGDASCRCCSTDCAFPEGTLCLTITSDGDFYEFVSGPEIKFSTDEFLLLFNPSPNPLIGAQLMLRLSGQKDLDDGTTICYRYAVPFFFNCVKVDGVTCYQLVVVHPKDVLAVYSYRPNPNSPKDTRCAYTTMEQFYGWGSYFLDFFGNTHFEPDVQVPGPTVPACDGSEAGGHFIYGYSDGALFAANAGILGSGDFFVGCGSVCHPSLPGGPEGGHGPLFPVTGYTPRTVGGTPVPIANPMDVSVTVPGSWFNIKCSSTAGYDLATFDDFVLTAHFEIDEACPDLAVIQDGLCYTYVNDIANWCPGVTPTTSTTTTSTSSTSSTSTTSTSSTTTTSTTTTETTSTTILPDDDTRPDCCPDGPFFEQIEIHLFVEPAGTGEACENCHSSGNGVWNSAENAYIYNFFSCGAGFTYPMQIKVFCLPDGEGGGSWYAELYCGGALMASMILGNQTPGGLCGGEPPAQMAGSTTAISTPCCPTATLVTIGVAGIFSGGPL
jgi:hypothetical protein